jgi:hypothetical protein
MHAEANVSAELRLSGRDGFASLSRKILSEADREARPQSPLVLFITD